MVSADAPPAAMIAADRIGAVMPDVALPMRTPPAPAAHVGDEAVIDKSLSVQIRCIPIYCISICTLSNHITLWAHCPVKNRNINLIWCDCMCYYIGVRQGDALEGREGSVDNMTTAELNQYLENIAKLIEATAGDAETAAKIVRDSKVKA